MDHRRLRYFVAVAEEQHFGRAAARLHMSQPPLSQRIRELEDELGCLLFERSARGVRLTEAGSVLLVEARRLLAAAELAGERVRQAGRRRTVVVGAVAGAGLDFGPRIVAAFRRTHPDTEVRLSESGIDDPTAGLRSGRVDLALTRLPFDTTGLTIRQLAEEPLVAALAADDPLATRSTVTVGDLHGRSWIRLPEEADRAWRAYWSAGAGATTPGPVVRSVAECLHAVLWQGAVGILPAAATHRHRTDGIAFVPLTGHPPSRIVLAWPSAHPDPVVLAFARAATTAAEQGPASP
ncbi:LysR substrate-binding domain-containing protein [Kitasatospora sp. NPDC048540]|uniref:LysR family transcriptional regulator n=1 Tax=unclassified Kitasatospora TaxID=2633591 RepID=UPI00053A7C13|nr:LysR substrate-binding domain-containing protein [Kitasatospora sp. MBT63]